MMLTPTQVAQRALEGYGLNYEEAKQLAEAYLLFGLPTRDELRSQYICINDDCESNDIMRVDAINKMDTGYEIPWRASMCRKCGTPQAHEEDVAYNNEQLMALERRLKLTWRQKAAWYQAKAWCWVTNWLAYPIARDLKVVATLTRKKNGTLLAITAQTNDDHQIMKTFWEQPWVTAE